MLETRHHHLLQLRLILRSHHGEIGDSPQIADVVLTLVRRTISADDASSIEHKRDWKLLDSDVVNELVESALKEGAVNRDNGA